MERVRCSSERAAVAVVAGAAVARRGAVEAVEQRDAPALEQLEAGGARAGRQQKASLSANAFSSSACASSARSSSSKRASPRSVIR